MKRNYHYYGCPAEMHRMKHANALSMTEKYQTDALSLSKYIYIFDSLKIPLPLLHLQPGRASWCQHKKQESNYRQNIATTNERA